MADREIALNDEQLAVAFAPVEACLLVIAGAGQGKTEVVASRIAALVAEEDLSASEEILVLSFSRAAVSAVQTRLDFRGVPAPNVRTFDSFASLLLLDDDIEPTGGFEARIRRATQLLKETDAAPEPVAQLRHVILDEIQDLVGDRADFVLTLLTKLVPGAGITALGDPLQSVFDFVLEESDSDTTSDDVFEALKNEFECDVVGLGKNYRARGAHPKRIVELGDELRKLDDGDEAEAFLEEFAVGQASAVHGATGEGVERACGSPRSGCVAVLWDELGARSQGLPQWRGHRVRRTAGPAGGPSDQHPVPV